MNGLDLTSIGERIRRLVRASLPKSLYRRGASVIDAWYGMRHFGLQGYQRLSTLSRSPVSDAPAKVTFRPLPHPFYVRPGTPDAGLVIQTIGREMYSYRLPDPPIHLIVDAGANIGDTAIWYASKFPKAQIVAIEPDPGNFDILSKNCAPYGARIRLFRAALWPVADRSLAITGATVAAQVRESLDENDLLCPTVDPLTILRESGSDVIDIFKIDIEGAELPLFSGDCDIWLRKTRSIAIEIHSQEAREAVFSATRRNGFKCAVYRELHVFSKFACNGSSEDIVSPIHTTFRGK